MDPSLYLTTAVPAISGLVELAKSWGLPDRAAPALALFLGFLASLARFYTPAHPWIPTLIAGLGMGLSSIGFHATATHTVKTVKRQRRGAGEGAPVRGAAASRSSVKTALARTWAGAPLVGAPRREPRATALGCPSRAPARNETRLQERAPAPSVSQPVKTVWGTVHPTAIVGARRDEPSPPPPDPGAATNL